MDMVQVQSSNIAAVGYDEDTLTLRVEFNSGATYDYKNVPPAVHSALMSSESLGQYLNMAIKSQFEYVRT